MLNVKLLTAFITLMTISSSSLGAVMGGSVASYTHISTVLDLK
jgi:hypothetical protein